MPLPIPEPNVPSGGNSGNGKRVSVYPNPANDKVTVNLGQRESGKIRLRSSGGTEIRVHNFELESSIELNISDLPNGVYYLLIETQDKSITEKFTKLNN